MLSTRFVTVVGSFWRCVFRRGCGPSLCSFVANRPRTVTTQLGEETIHLVALPQTSISDLSFPVTMMFAGQIAGGDLDRFRLLGRTIRLPAPSVVGARTSQSQAGSEEFGLPVVQTRWTVYLPEDLDAAPVREPGATNLTWHTDSDSWVDYEMQRLSQLKTEVAELTRIAGSKRYSARQRAQARSNLKQLGLAVQDYYDLGDRGLKASSGAVREFESFREELAQEAITNSAIALDDAARGFRSNRRRWGWCPGRRWTSLHHRAEWPDLRQQLRLLRAG